MKRNIAKAKKTAARKTRTSTNTKQAKTIVKTTRSRQKRRKKPTDKSKKISLKDAIDKVVEVVKPIFSSSRKIDSTSAQSISQYEDQQQNQYVDVPFAERDSQAVQSKFFYAVDLDINSNDDQQLYELLAKKYPGIHASEANETNKRNAIVSILNDVDLMQKILEDYNMTILDFFKFLFRLCPSMFKGLFVKKIQKTLRDKPYAQSIRFGKYSFEKRKGSSKKCSIF